MQLLLALACACGSPTAAVDDEASTRPAPEVAAKVVGDAALEFGGTLRDEAAALAERCDAGELTACEKAVPRDRLMTLGQERHWALLRRGCDGGEPFACWRALELTRAHELAAAACRDGAGDCVAHGLLAANLGATEEAKADGRALVAKACDAGSARACFNLATWFEDGVSAPPDLDRALELYKRACDGDDALACNNAAKLLHDQVNVADACAFSRRACALGHGQSCSNAGVCDDDAKSFADAAQRYRQACSLADVLGCYNLAHLYRRGDGVPRSRDTGVYLFELACTHGYRPACNDATVLAQEPLP
ncbi:MAG: tetratricopeptide repeat protein [Nannocystaceae bacterium]